MSDRTNRPFTRQIGRRAFLQGSSLLLAGSALAWDERLLNAAEETVKPKLRIGLVTDLHYADKPASGARNYRQSLTKLADAATQFDKDKPDHIIALGDLIDSAPSLDAEKANLKRVAAAFTALPGKHHFVLGNHCVESLTKPEYLEIVGQEKSYFSFDAAGYHVVILDACFNRDGAPYGRKNFSWGDANIVPAELDWLKADLAKTDLKSIVCVHQCLDVDSQYCVRNAKAVREVLEQSGKVLGVFQGHYHAGNYKEIHGIHYCTQQAMVEGAGLENSSYATLDILPGDAIRLTGFRKQPSRRWGAV